METFSALLAPWEGNPLVTGGFPSQRPVKRRFDVSFDLRLSKRFRKQSRRRWSGRHRAHYDATVMTIDDTPHTISMVSLVSLLWAYCIIFSLSCYDGTRLHTACSPYRGHFSLKNSRTTPHSSHVRARYGVLFVSAKFDGSLIIAVLFMTAIYRAYSIG